MDLTKYYILHGWRKHRDPSPLFSVQWYLQRQNPDVARGGIRPLTTIFNSRWYRGAIHIRC